MNSTARRALTLALVLLALAAAMALGWRGYSARQAAKQAQTASVKDPVN